MGEIKIVNKLYARYKDRYNLKEISDLKDMVLTPQVPIPGIALNPEVSFVLANEEDRFILIHVALDDKGNYCFGYNVHLDFCSSGCHPSYWRDHKSADTLVKCVSKALDYLMELSFYYNTPPDRRLVKAVSQAKKKLNACRLRQMSIFDMLTEKKIPLQKLTFISFW